MSAPVLPRGHDEFEELAVAWAIDALEPADHEKFESHQEGCDDCAATVIAALRIATELAYGVPDIEPPAFLRQRVLAAATPLPPAQGHSPEDLIARRTADKEPTADPGRTDTGSVDVGGKDRGHTDSGRNDDHTGGSWTDSGSIDDRRTDGSHADGSHGGSGRAAGLGGETAGRRHETGRSGGKRAVRTGRSGDHRAGRNRAGSAPDGRGARQVRPAGATDRRGRSWSLSSRRVMTVFAAAALVGISAVTTWQITRPAPSAGPVAAAERVAVLSTQAGNRTVGTVIVRSDRTDVVTDGLSPNTGRGTWYFVWGVPAGQAGAPQVVGTFQVTSEGLHSYPVQLTRSLDDYPVLAVSEEPAGSTPTAPSSVLARGAFG